MRGSTAIVIVCFHFGFVILCFAIAATDLFPPTMISDRLTYINSPNDVQTTSVDDLLQKLAAIQCRRRQVKALRQQIYNEKKQALQDRLNHATLLQEQVLLDYRSVLYQNQKNQNLWELAGQWNSWTDCFQISHRGSFGTINGLRLGAEAPASQMPSTNDTEGSEGTATTTIHTATTSPPRMPFSFLLHDNNNNNNNPSNNASANTISSTVRATIKVPWVEINAALGHVALLLVTMQQKLQSIDHAFVFRHVLKPQGSNSQIGTRRNNFTSNRDTNQVACWYPLYSDDHSFPFVLMGKRNFQTALQCLVECVVDASQAIQNCDRTIVLPYPMEKHQHQWTVGGSSIQYNFNGGDQYNHDAIEWTRAMKYLLTNLKQLMTFRAFHLYGDS